jgi:hypothetical protein
LHGYFGLNILAFLFFPGLFGSPSGNFRATLGVPFLNYNESNSFYIGSLILFMALLSFIWLRDNRKIRFFASACVVWFIYFFNIGGVDKFLELIPGVSLLLPNRSHIIWLFSLSCCAGISIDHLVRLQGVERKQRWWIPALTAAFAMIFIAFGSLQAINLTSQFAKQLLGYTWLANVPAHIVGICLTFGLGILALIVIYQTESPRIRLSMCGIILLIVFWQSGYQFKTHNPITPNSLFYPLTPAIQTLQKTVGNANIVILGNDTLPADSNLVYRISLLTNYDALWVKNQDKLFRDMYSAPTYPFGAPTLTLKASSLGLTLFGVEYVVGQASWLGVDTELADTQLNASKVYPLGEITSDERVIQTFTATKNGLSRVMLMAGTYNRTNNCHLAVQLESLPDHSSIAAHKWDCNQVPNNGPLVLKFPAITNSQNKGYQLVVYSADGTPTNAVTLLAKSDLEYQGGTLFTGKRTIKGGLWFDFGYDDSNFKAVATIGPYTVYQFAGSLGKYYTVSNAIFTQTDEESWRLLHDPTFDPKDTVIISGVTPDSDMSRVITPGETSRGEVLSQTNTGVTLNISRSTPGYLVLSTTYYPGWKVKVNGTPQSILKANYAFSAIKLGPGANTVEYYYDPDSVHYGFAISFISLLCGILLMARWIILKREPEKQPQKKDSL